MRERKLFYSQMDPNTSEVGLIPLVSGSKRIDFVYQY